MKIAIIGGGASGLTAYLFLVKNLPQPPAPSPPHEYVIYESHTVIKRKQAQGTYEVPLVGAGLGIAPNGMNVLYELDQDLYKEVQSKGFPATGITFRNGRGWRLGASNALHDYGDHVDAMVMISREDVLESLFSRVPESIIVNKTVSKVTDGSRDQQATVEFTDGTSNTFDLVLGADGVWSKTRAAVLGSEHPPHYTGLFGVGGFMPSSLLSPLPESAKEAAATPQVIMTFGGNGFFGYSPCTNGSNPVTRAQLLGKDSVLPGARGFWWSSFERKDPDTRSVDMEEMRGKLKERHSGWQDPTIQRILESEDLDMRGVATWVMPKAPTWVGKRVVLVGDAAHALPSSSGQGISQSMLDSQAISMLLAHNLKQVYESQKESESASLEPTLAQYMQVRKRTVEEVLDVANRMGDNKKDTGFIGEMLMYGMLKVIFTFFGDSMMKPLVKYDLRKEIEKAVSKA